MVGALPALKETVYKQTTKEMVRHRLASLIASGILQLDDELPSERELAVMLSVSRETVRGAVQSLAGEGILQVSQGARTRIINVNVNTQRIGVTHPNAINGYDLAAVHQARLLVELDVVSDAALRLSAADLGRLDDTLAAQQEALDDPMRYLICDREFHLTIYYAAENRLLADFTVDLYTYMLDRRRVVMAQPGAIQRSLQDHREIVACLKARDPEATRAAFRRHIQRIYDTSQALEAEPRAAQVRGTPGRL
jgi:DNA-binding FadR family transcriptional regulator